MAENGSDTKPLILAIDDNSDILLNLKITLESNNYRIITTESGVEALKILSELKELPDVIISDIMMPDINGYQLFEAISKTPRMNLIPFIFLTAKTSPEDVRFGKMLGVDDYITKPFKEKDLIAVIEGKIARQRKGTKVNEKLDILLSAMNVELLPSISKEEKSDVIIIYVLWDDVIGPLLKKFYPKDHKIPVSIKDISSQLFQATVTIYGHDKLTKAEGILLYIDNIKRSGYILFDAISDPGVRGGETQFMLGLIAPNINYLESLRIKKLFEEISNYVKNKNDWDIVHYWEKSIEILSSPPV
jgi:CheY-like chemotaxis protein